MEKVDFKKKYKELYSPSSKAPAIVSVPSLQYAVLGGTGDPNTSKDFSHAIEALFGLSYTISMSYKKTELIIPGFYSYTVGPLEGVWDIIDGKAFDKSKKDNLKWTIGIIQPEFVTATVFEKAVDFAAVKKKNSLIKQIKLQKYADGLCCTFMHLGTYDDETKSFDLMNRFIESEGYERAEKNHREIYLSDFRKVSPEKLKTILRFKISRK